MAQPEAKPEEWNKEILTEMRRLGMPCPAGCPDTVWFAPTEFDSDISEIKFETVIELLLLGWSYRKIASTLQINLTALSKLIKSDSFQNSLSDARKKRAEEVSKAVINKLYLPAVNTVEQIMLDENQKGATRLSAAMYTIDHAIGRAEQKVQHTGNIVSEVLHHIEELKSRAVDEIETSARNLPQDPIDSFVENFISANEFKVGTRSEGES